MIHDSVDNTELTTSGLRVGAYGWQHPHWLGSFYPDDLPADWQLGYYANEFNTVLVPAQYLQAEDCDIEQWLDDVHEAFRFYLQAPIAEMSSQQFEQQCSQFGDYLGGVVVQSGVQLNVKVPVYHDDDVADDQHHIWHPDGSGQSGVALLKVDGVDLKTQRFWLEAFAQQTMGQLQAIFLCDESLTLAQLRDFKTLVELMAL